MTANNANIYAQISSYTGRLIREKFGKGPASVYVTINKPFITVYLKDFIAPMEQVLLQKGEMKRIEETREVMMEELLPHIKDKLRELAEIEVEKLHYDWNLENRTGIIFGMIGGVGDSNPDSIYPEKVEKAFYAEIKAASEKGQKMPEATSVFWLNDRTIVTERKGILVEIEKELIKNRFTEELKLTKRPMEKRLVNQQKLEKILGCRIEDTFVDWNFEKDIGYFVFIISPQNPKQ